jgi:hypothetical protein
MRKSMTQTSPKAIKAGSCGRLKGGGENET